MKAMCIADSHCTKKGCVEDDFGRIGCGYFRMNIWQFKVIKTSKLSIFSNAMNRDV